MKRRDRTSVRDLPAAEQKIAQLHFKAAHMRLWKEKDAEEAAALRESNVKTLVAEINSRAQQIAILDTARNRFESNWLQVSQCRWWRWTRPLRSLFPHSARPLSR